VILLDTHVLIWWAAKPGQAPGLLVSAISCWEVASIPAVRLLPLEPAVAVAATRLPEPFHADPADRVLVAQSRELAVPLLSADRKIRDYPHGQSVW
jgi:PIN domain nuclease of toxin-antitoxin system